MIVGAVLPTSLRTQPVATLIQAYCVQDRADQKVVPRSTRQEKCRLFWHCSELQSWRGGVCGHLDYLGSTLMVKPLQTMAGILNTSICESVVKSVKPDCLVGAEFATMPYDSQKAQIDDRLSGPGS
jgi:hypothetical protein